MITPADVREAYELCTKCGEKCDPPCWTLSETSSAPRGSDSRTSPDGSVTVTVPCDETSGELP